MENWYNPILQFRLCKKPLRLIFALLRISLLCKKPLRLIFALLRISLLCKKPLRLIFALLRISISSMENWYQTDIAENSGTDVIFLHFPPQCGSVHTQFSGSGSPVPSVFFQHRKDLLLFPGNALLIPFGNVFYAH